MSDEYQLRKDIDRIISVVNQLEWIMNDAGVDNLNELLSKYYDSSDVDVRNWKLNDDLEDTTATANTADSKATTANNKATEVRKVLYSGNSDTGTSGNPATGTVKANLNVAESNISTVQGDMGNVDRASGDIQSQIIQLFDIIPNLIMVDTIAERDRLDNRFCRFVYVKSDGKFYKYIGEDILGG